MKNNSPDKSVAEKSAPSPLKSILSGQQPSGLRHIDLSDDTPAGTSSTPAPERKTYGKHPGLVPRDTGKIKTHRPKNRTATEDDSAASDIQADFSPLRLTGTASVSRIIDPLRVQLSDGRIVQLAGLDIPGLHAHSPSEISIEARDFLVGLLSKTQVRIHQTKDNREGRMNRMGYHLAHLEVRDTGLWVQGALLRNGYARVYPTERNPEMAAQMIAQEDTARRHNEGLWNMNQYQALTPKTAGRGLNDWALVEGEVFDAASVRNTIYLNFGPDWRTDFTIAVDPAIRRQLAKNNINPLGLKGKTVRVRGWLEDYNGPFIRLNHAAWLEVDPPSLANQPQTP